MIDCDKFKEHVSDYLEKQLSPQVRSDFERHINQCSECKLIVEQIPQIKSSLSRLGKIQCSNDFSMQLRQRLIAGQQKSYISNANVKKISYGFSFAAAVFLLFLGINIFSDTENVIPQAQNKEINSSSSVSNQHVKHASVETEPVNELEVKTKSGENTFSDSTSEDIHNAKNPRVKYVDTK